MVQNVIFYYASMAAFTLLRDLMLCDLCIMLLLKVSPRVDALIELRRLLRSKVRKMATCGTSLADFLKYKIELKAKLNKFHMKWSFTSNCNE